MVGLQGWIGRPHQAEFAEWCRRRCPRLWLLGGEAGSGKSELLQRFLEHCRDQSVPVLRLDHAVLEAADRDGEAVLRRLDCGAAHGFVVARRPPPPAAATWAAAMADAVAGELRFWAGQGREPPAQVELAMVLALHHDMAHGGVVLVDDWDRLAGEVVRSRLVFRRPGPPAATPTAALQPLADWLWGVAAFLMEHDVAVVVAGRRLPGDTGHPRLDAATVAWPPPAPFSPDEVGRHLRLVVDGLPAAPEAALDQMVAATGGNPLLVSLLAGYVRTVLVPGMATGVWEAVDDLVAGYLGDPEFGPIARPGGGQGGRRDLRLWRLAVPRTLDRDMAGALFPLGEGPPAGRALFDHYVALGLVRRRASRPESFRLPPMVATALERFARDRGLWPSRQFDAVNRRLAEVHRQRGAVLDAARHTVLGYTGFEARFGVPRERVWAELSRSGLAVADRLEAVAGLAESGPAELGRLRAFLAEAAACLRRPDAGATAEFVELAGSRRLSLDEVARAGLDLDAIVDANPTDWPVLRLVTGLQGLPPARRDSIRARAVAAGCRDLDLLCGDPRPGRLAEALATLRQGANPTEAPRSR